MEANSTENRSQTDTGYAPFDECLNSDDRSCTYIRDTYNRF